jgi:oligosaccharide reducing-end xylanase
LITTCLTLASLFIGCSSGKQITGAYKSGNYPNLFNLLLGKSDAEIKVKLEHAFNQLFYGNDSTERIYYPVGNDMAYLEDILHKDVRSEGMSYGLMITVQLDKKTEFDKLWKWMKTYMQFSSGESMNYFAWQMHPDGRIMDSTSAPDGEEWTVMALLFASSRWGDGEGIFNYKKEALTLLNEMYEKDDKGFRIKSMFNKKEKQVVFVPEPQANFFTDPSYHLPHFYELWGMHADKYNQFWQDAADTSRSFLKKTVHPVTGLAPDYSQFDGKPYSTPWNPGAANFQYDAWRVAMNVAVDYVWFKKDDWAVAQSNRLLDFFMSVGLKTHGNVFTLDGKQLINDHSLGLVSMNAVAALASTNENRKLFVEELWNADVPTGQYRYYDSVLYMLGMLQVSGNFRIY